MPVTIEILNFSDWHGQLDPITTTLSDGGFTVVGGASALELYFDQERGSTPNTLLVTAGDVWGATPLISNQFGDLPAVDALNKMRVDYDTFGNHNFDKGVAAAQVLVDCAKYTFVSSNLTGIGADGGLSTKVKAPFVIATVGGIKVGIVGITNFDAPTLTRPGAFGTMTLTTDTPSTASAAMAAQTAARAAV